MESKYGNLKNILLVENDPRDVELTLETLDKYQLADKVIVVNDSAEALDYLYRRGKFKARPGGNPSLLLLDYKMPRISGLEVLETIKADENLKTICVQVLNER